MRNSTVESINKYLIVKTEPELRHILAHMMFAIECLIKKCPNGAMDNIKSIEGLVMFDGDDPEDWERYYRNVKKREGVMQVGCKKRGGKKKCKGR